LDWIYDTDPIEGQISFLMVAATMVTTASLNLFRYKAGATYYDSFDAVSSINWWKWSDLICEYATLVIGSIAFVTQLI
jgi:hypothetical protein